MTSWIALASLAFLACAAPTRRAAPMAASTAPPPAHRAPPMAPSGDVAAVSSSAPPSEPAASTEPPPPPPLPPCNADGFGFAVESPYDLACDDHMHCRGTPRFRIRNCRESALEAHVRVVPPGDVGEARIDFAPIEPGRDAIHSINVGRGGSFAVSARFATDDGLDAAVLTPLVVTASARDRAVAACDACHGEWGRHGMLQIENCICRTNDAGHACEDPRDCEGECVPTGHRVVQPGHPPRRMPDGTVSVAETLAVAVGRCSEFRAVFGCHAYIPEGSRDRGPVPIRLLPRGMVCRD